MKKCNIENCRGCDYEVEKTDIKEIIGSIIFFILLIGCVWLYSFI